MRIRTLSAVLLLAWLALAAVPRPAAAQWAASGTPLSTAPSDQFNSASCPDGRGGAIVVWSDARAGAYTYDLYAQRISVFGVAQWTTNGVPVCTAIEDQLRPVIVSDGKGGAIIAWEDFRSGDADVYAQRLDSLGTALWTPQGVPVCTDTTPQATLRIVSDNARGAIVVWEDFREFAGDVYGQRIDSLGVVRWTLNGHGICTDIDDQFLPEPAPDGAGGVIVTWFDNRNFEFDIFAQRVSASGTNLWAVDGVPVCLELGEQESPVIAPVPGGGAIIAWEDFREVPGISYDVFAQRLNSAGVRQWAAAGVPLCTNESDQRDLEIVPDGSAGAIVAWQDDRDPLSDIFAQRVSSTGAVQWAANGVEVCGANGVQQNPKMIADGAGGAIVLWADPRTSAVNLDLYAQRLGPTGARAWAVDGVALTTAIGNQNHASVVSDGAGGLIAAWDDARSGTSSDVYAQRVTAGGTVAPGLASVPGAVSALAERLGAFPNPSRHGTRVHFALAAGRPVTLEVYDLEGRRVRMLARSERLPAGRHTRVWDGLDDDGRRVRDGVYWIRMTAPGATSSTRVSVLR